MDFEENFTAMQEKIAADIERVGWSAIGVFPNDRDNGSVPFCYSIGLTELQHPEVVIYGLSMEQMHGLLRGVYHCVKEEDYHFHSLEHTDKLCDPPFKFAMMPVPGAGPPANMAINYYGESIELLQAVWQDESGNFPWDAGWMYTPQRQPVLYHNPFHADLHPDWEDGDE